MAIPSIKEDVAAIKARLDSADEHRRNTSEKLDLLLSQTASIPPTLIAISEKLDRSAKEAEALDGRVSALETKQTEIDAKLGLVRWVIGIGATILAGLLGAIGFKISFHS